VLYSIVMWSGTIANIPIGWHLCDGTSGTPNLVDRFIVGAGSMYEVGATGGEATHILTVAELAQHTHALSGGQTGGESVTHTHSTLTDGGHTHGVTDPGHTHLFDIQDEGQGWSTDGINVHDANYAAGVTRSAVTGITITAGNSPHNHTLGNNSVGHTHSLPGLSDTGSSAAHENRPPYYALCYIMKL